MTLYIVSLEYGIVKVDSKNQVKTENMPDLDAGLLNQEVDINATDLNEEINQQEENTTSNWQKDSSNVTANSQKIENAEFTSAEEVCEENVLVNEGMVDLSEKTLYDIETIGEVDMQNVILLEKTLHRLPMELVSHLYNNGWKNCVTDENIGQVYMHNNNQYKAAIVWGKKMIVVEDRSEAIEGVIHEVGHYLDGINNRPSASEEFHQIYLDEAEIFKANVVDGACVHSESEFFAHTFYYYIVNPSKCTPKAYQFIESQLNILKEHSL